MATLSGAIMPPGPLSGFIFSPSSSKNEVETRHNEVNMIGQPAEGKGHHNNDHHLHHLEEKGEKQKNYKQVSTPIKTPFTPHKLCCNQAWGCFRA